MTSLTAQELRFPRGFGWVARLLNDPRDWPFIPLMVQCAMVAACGVGLFFVQDYFWYLAVAYWILNGVWVTDRFILMLHCTSHRPLFKPEVRVLNYIIPWLLGPFCGETPETYFAHHMGMHHREENLTDDLSSTMKYRRNRFGHWLRYYLRFMFFGLPELGAYFRRRHSRKLLRRMLIGELTFWGVVVALGFVNLWATLVVLVVPVLAVRTLMMIGNWGQHAFVCQEQPDNPYRSSITCINTRYNRRCFNDGYHIHHHVRARCHWSDYPAEFRDNAAEYGRQDAIVFDGIDFFGVWLLLMIRAERRLARHFVRLPGAPVRSEAEILELFRSRLAPFSRAALAQYSRALAPEGARQSPAANRAR